MKKILYIAMLLLSCAAYAQSQVSWSEIRTSSEYCYGEGYGTSVAEADQNALANLLSKISVTVSSRFELSEEEINRGGVFDASSYAQSKVNSFTNGTLTNTSMLTLKGAPDAYVVRWIKTSDIEKIFDSRRTKIHDFLRAAYEQETKRNIDNALRYYWWANLLNKSLPSPTSETFTDHSGTSRKLHTWIPDRMNDIFDNIKVSTTSIDEDNVVYVNLQYKGEPISSLDYTYYDGKGWSEMVGAKDGIGILELYPGAPTKTLDLRIEYQYANNAHIDDEIKNVMGIIHPAPLRKSQISFSGNAAASLPQNAQTASVSKPETTTAAAASIAKTENTETASVAHDLNSILREAASATLSAVSDETKYNETVSRVLAAINTKNYDSVSKCFTGEGLDIYQRLLKYGKAKILESEVNFHNLRDNVVARGIKMSFSFANGLKKSFVEDVVFTFNNEGLIDNITFGLGETGEKDILHKGVWAEEARTLIMEFLENYKTAFALKRLDYINGIFDEHAVIIIGNKVPSRSRVSDSSMGNLTYDQINYVRKTKGEYLESLERCFASNEYINIRFTNNDVMKMATGGELYGIQIRQDYYSTNYGDTGYLTLLVDFNNPEEPLIKVRTWQPEPDPEFGLITPFDF